MSKINCHRYQIVIACKHRITPTLVEKGKNRLFQIKADTGKYLFLGFMIALFRPIAAVEVKHYFISKYKFGWRN